MTGKDDLVNSLQLTVNGEREQLTVQPGETLLSTLRSAGYYSVKNGCDEGVCGACNVILDDEELTKSCLVTAESCDDKDVTTVKGLLNDDGELHPLQEEFLERGAAQCGYCIPGVLISAYHLLQQNPAPSEEEIADALSGNICRCTGYVQQIEAIQAAAKRLPSSETSAGAETET